VPASSENGSKNMNGDPLSNEQVDVSEHPSNSVLKLSEDGGIKWKRAPSESSISFKV
jgi:hypothetical protein